MDTFSPVRETGRMFTPRTLARLPLARPRWVHVRKVLSMGFSCGRLAFLSGESPLGYLDILLSL